MADSKFNSWYIHCHHDKPSVEVVPTIRSNYSSELLVAFDTKVAAEDVANLVIAAPRLYEEVRKFRKEIKRQISEAEKSGDRGMAHLKRIDLDAIDRAIAKAEGRSS